ncbi:hypothetical protein BCR37DRAFT_48806 [Protomyces lactucae-debilis]|uniref:PRA1 family protein n=1 Tax=Protomyces lactucae-debilis TaxID=2754530 RepID=A0A1Y2FCF4_PROLT|nr:uncharacterized protein BCR37DRAFT_48806 [Protomyces lactucae-debilis]ORY81610.1 hypothetical protein BCR37DRAFT_48806 [Protomyces lactucae-debilis]
MGRRLRGKVARSEETYLDEEQQVEILCDLERQADSKGFRYITLALIFIISLLLAFLATSATIALTMLSLSSLALTAFKVSRPNECNGPLSRWSTLLNALLNVAIVLSKLRGSAYVWMDVHVMPTFIVFLAGVLQHGSEQAKASLEDLQRQRYKLKGV